MLCQFTTFFFFLLVHRWIIFPGKMTFIPADSLTFHCRKCSGTINESNLSSNVGSDPFRWSLSRDVVVSKSPYRGWPAGTLRGRRPLLTLLLTPVLYQTQKGQMSAVENIVRDCFHRRCRSESPYCGNCAQSHEGAATAYICMPQTATRLIFVTWQFLAGASESHIVRALAGVKSFDEACGDGVMSLPAPPIRITVSVK